MSEAGEKRIKQSFIAGSLTSSAGIFLSKAIGLFYVVPFTAIAGQENMVFYTSAYNYYNVLLQICSAGLPYAIAAVVAKYANQDDWKTVLLVRKLSAGILSVSGFLMMFFFALFSGALSRSSLGMGATPIDIQQMRTTYIILSLALFLVPVLYSYRGFYQGLKELRTYAESQVIEQFGRVFSLLGLGMLVVYVFHMDRIWAVYMAVLATSIGALMAIAYYYRYDRTHIGPINRAARAQTQQGVNMKDLSMELFAFGVPYLIASFFGNSQALVNTRFFIPVSTQLGMQYETAKTLLSIIQLQCDKLTSIPQVLGIGFSAGIVPYMTIALENNDKKELQKDVRECLDTVLYIGLPVCFAMWALARPIYFLMYGGGNLDYAEGALQWSSLLALCTTITPICSSMMMTLHLRKESMIYLFVGFLIKCATFYPLMRATGYAGAITSSVLCSLAIIYLSLAKISNKFGVNYMQTLRRMGKIFLCCLCMNGGFAILKLVGFAVSEESRGMALWQLAVYAVVGMVIYFFTSSLMKLPQSIFRVSVKDLLRGILRGRIPGRRRR